MKINMADIEQVTETIDKAEKGCKARTLPDDFAADMISTAERRLKELRIPQKGWKGCQIIWHPEKVANSYKGKAEGTSITLTRGSNAWFMTHCSRVPAGSVSYGEGVRIELALTESAIALIPRHQRL